MHAMKAIVHSGYGPPEEVLEIGEIDSPVPGDGEVLIRVRATSVNHAEWHLTTGTPYLVRPEAGLTKPKRLVIGADVAGVVETVGPNVKQFSPGDEVFGEIGAGAYAEYVAVSEDRVVAKPAGVSFEDAAAIPMAGLTALQGLRDKAGVRPGQQVLIIGASGGVGTFAVQIAKALGAEVTAVVSARNVDTARELGADHVIDYTQEDFVAGGRRYDIVFDVPGNRSVADYEKLLGPHGTYVMIGGPKGRWLGPLPHMLKMSVGLRLGGRRMAWFVQKMNREDLTLLGEWAESGTITPVIVHRVDLSEVPAALARQGEGHSQGKTVITV
jgi:NADPH:quinone reductase-like Zn-dependent oxidoreductase